MTTHQARWFRRLVRVLFPGDFRAAYEADMTRTFSAQEQEARESGVRAVARLWLETLTGLLRTAPREHLAQLRQDVAFALRMMWRTPAFSVIAILTLATGIGANTAMFSIVNAIMLRSLPYADPDRVAMLWNHWPGSDKAALSMPELLDFRERAKTVDVAAWANDTANLMGDGDPERVRVAVVTANMLELLGVVPALGQGFSTDHEKTSPSVQPLLGDEIVLTDELWRRRFGGVLDIVGRRVVLDRQPVTIVGVLPPGFALPTEFDEIERVAVLRPVTLNSAGQRNNRGVHFLQAVARVRPGFSFDQADGEIAGIAEHWRAQEWRGDYDDGYGASLLPVQTEVAGEVRRPLLVLLGAVGLVLLIACANVANLLLARSQARSQEIGVRKAAGASEARLVRQAITESLVLAGAGGATGIAMAQWLTTLVARSAPQLPRVADAGIEGTVLWFTVVVSVAAALLFGGLPAVQMARRDVTENLSNQSSRATSKRALRGVLVAAQIALALILLIGAALLMQSFARLVGVPTGIDPDRVLTLRVSLPTDGYRERERTVRFFDELLDGVRALPGVRGAGAVSSLPLSQTMFDATFYLPGEVANNGNRNTDFAVVTPGYLEAIGTKLLRGRLHGRSDIGTSPAVAVINDYLARTFFPGSDPIGQQIRFGFGQPWTIVGIVEDVRHRGLSVPPQSQVYLPHSQFTPFWPDTTVRSLALVVRTSGEPSTLTSQIRARLRELDANVPIAQVTTMHDIVDQSVASERLQTGLLAAFAAIALLLAVVGTYGVLAYQVTERTREIGLRMMLGANKGDVLRLIVRQGMLPAAAGVIAGLAGAALVSRGLETLLFETTPLDAATFGVAAAALLLAALGACVVPARRALRLEPGTALRAE